MNKLEEQAKELFLDSSPKKLSDPMKGESKITDQGIINSKDAPKWKGMEKVTLLLTDHQRDTLEKIARQLMRFRNQSNRLEENRERITVNTLVRALIDHFLDRAEFLKQELIWNEQDLYKWIEPLFADKKEVQ